MTTTITEKTVFLLVTQSNPVNIVLTNHLITLGANRSNIFTVSNGRLALDEIQKRHFDLVISNWELPLLSGLDLLKIMRAEKKLYRTPILLIASTDIERSQLHEAIIYGVNGIIMKPYTAPILTQHIEKGLLAHPRFIEGAANGISFGITKKLNFKATILVVDDTPDNLRFLSGILKDDYLIRIANNGEKALAICQSNTPPDLVLLDIMMPDMDGFEVATRLYEHPISEHIPVIFVTAMDTIDARIKGMELGAVDFITKPIDPDLLLPKVRNFLRFVKMHKQLQTDYNDMIEAAKEKENMDFIIRQDIKKPVGEIVRLVNALGNSGSMARQQLIQLKTISKIATQVIGTINLSPELHKIESGQFELKGKNLDIGVILHQLVDGSRVEFSEKRLTITVDTDIASIGEETPKIIGDELLCHSLFQSIITHACEIAPENTRVLISMIDENPMKITVQNSGVIAKDKREKIFVKSEKSTDTGMYLPKLLVEAQHGSISLDVSDNDNKTVVTINLPRA